MMAKRKARTIYLDPEDHTYLSQLAISEGTSISGTLRQLLRDLRPIKSGPDDMTTLPRRHSHRHCIDGGPARVDSIYNRRQTTIPRS